MMTVTSHCLPLILVWGREENTPLISTSWIIFGHAFVISLSQPVLMQDQSLTHHFSVNGPLQNINMIKNKSQFA